MTLTELIGELIDQLAHHGGDVKVVVSRDLGFTDIAGVDATSIFARDDDTVDGEPAVVVQTG